MLQKACEEKTRPIFPPISLAVFCCTLCGLAWVWVRLFLTPIFQIARVMVRAMPFHFTTEPIQLVSSMLTFQMTFQMIV